MLTTNVEKTNDFLKFFSKMILLDLKVEVSYVRTKL